MKLEIYNQEKHLDKLNNYRLTNLESTDSPKAIIEKSIMYDDRFAIAILNDEDVMVGFFCLHTNTGPQEYGFSSTNSVLLRGFSIDENYRNLGYASKSFDNIFNFIKKEINPSINKVILAVNENNFPAQKTYKKSGFKVVKEDIKGTKGNLFIMQKDRE